MPILNKLFNIYDYYVSLNTTMSIPSWDNLSKEKQRQANILEELIIIRKKNGYRPTRLSESYYNFYHSKGRTALEAKRRFKSSIGKGPWSGFGNDAYKPTTNSPLSPERSIPRKSPLQSTLFLTVGSVLAFMAMCSVPSYLVLSVAFLPTSEPTPTLEPTPIISSTHVPLSSATLPPSYPGSTIFPRKPYLTEVTPTPGQPPSPDTNENAQLGNPEGSMFCLPSLSGGLGGSLKYLEQRRDNKPLNPFEGLWEPYTGPFTVIKGNSFIPWDWNKNGILQKMTILMMYDTSCVKMNLPYSNGLSIY